MEFATSGKLTILDLHGPPQCVVPALCTLFKKELFLTIALTLRKYRTAFAIEGNMNSSAIDLSDILESREQ